MKKALSYSLFIASALLLSLSSCKKNDTSETKKSTGTHKTARTLDEDYAANPDNPYDDVGYNHNIGLQATRSVWSDPKSTKEDDYNALVAYCRSLGYSPTMTSDELFNTVSAIQSDAQNKCVNFVKSTALSEAAKSYEDKIFELGADLSVYPSYNEYRTAMINLEASVAQDKNISADDMQTVLSSASVARHSILYWAREAAGDNGNPDTNSNPCACPKWWQKFKDAVNDWWDNINWTNVVVGDIGGGVAGIGGGPVGIFFGSLGGSIIGSAT